MAEQSPAARTRDASCCPAPTQQCPTSAEGGPVEAKVVSADLGSTGRPELSAAASRAASYRSRTGITQAEYDRLLAAQDGHCALCPNTPKTRRLHVDHDHATGRVRGLLCFRCNRFLPSWVTREWALRVAEYVA